MERASIAQFKGNKIHQLAASWLFQCRRRSFRHFNVRGVKETDLQQEAADSPLLLVLLPPSLHSSPHALIV